MSKPVSKRVQGLGNQVGWHLDQIKELFRGEVKLTVIARTDGYPERDFVLTSDNLDEVIAALERSKKREAQS